MCKLFCCLSVGSCCRDSLDDGKIVVLLLTVGRKELNHYNNNDIMLLRLKRAISGRFPFDRIDLQDPAFGRTSSEFKGKTTSTATTTPKRVMHVQYESLCIF